MSTPGTLYFIWGCLCSNTTSLVHHIMMSDERALKYIVGCSLLACVASGILHCVCAVCMCALEIFPKQTTWRTSTPSTMPSTVLYLRTLSMRMYHTYVPKLLQVQVLEYSKIIQVFHVHQVVVPSTKCCQPSLG